MASSTALLAFSFALEPEAGVPAYGEYAVLAGYGLTSALISYDWAASNPSSMLRAPRGASASDVPRRSLSPWLVYSPATLGALVSLSRSVTVSGASNRELALGFGGYALVPALSGLILGLLDQDRAAERAPYEPWLASGPYGSLGLTVGGKL